MAYHAKQALIAKGRPDTKFGMGFTSDTHESNIGQIRWKKLAPGSFAEKPVVKSTLEIERTKRRNERVKDYRARRAAGQAGPLSKQGLAAESDIVGPGRKTSDAGDLDRAGFAIVASSTSSHKAKGMPIAPTSSAPKPLLKWLER